MSTFERAELSIAASAGRQLRVLVAGPPAAIPLIFHNGTPFGLVAYEPMVTAAADRGLRMVLYERPGYGESTPQPGRRVADAAADVAAILDQLGTDRFVTIGWSGGGPHALACAALLPGRCLAAATMAGAAPYDAEGLDWLDGMAPENVTEFDAAASGEPELTAFLEAARAELRDIGPDEIAAGLGDLVSAADQAVVAGGFAEYLAASMRAAVAAGIDGWRDDDLAFTSGWGFDVRQAGAVPVAIWQGDQDQMVPFAHGDWLAGHVPSARRHMIPAAGHLTLAATSFGDILDDLLVLAS